MNIIIELDAETIVDRVWEANDACQDCKYCNRIREPHGAFTESCGLLERGGEYSDCPGFDSEAEQMEADVIECIKDSLPDGASVIEKSKEQPEG